MVYRFATSILDIDPNYIIVGYKFLWRIEIMFGVQDGSWIKTKLRDMWVPYFLFVYEQPVGSIWYLIYDREMRFKS